MKEIEGKIRKIGSTWYKRSRIKNAFAWRCGEWVASGRLNSDIFRESNCIMQKNTGPIRRTVGMSNVMTYCEAIRMQKAIDAGETTLTAQAKLAGSDFHNMERALGLLFSTGASAFHRYGTESEEAAR